MTVVGFAVAGCETAAAQGAAPISAKGIEASAALERGDVDQAALLYTAAIDDPSIANDHRAMLLTERAAALLKRRKFKAALDDLNKAAGLYPEYAAIYVNRGNLLLAMGQGTETLKEAVKDFDRAIALSPRLSAAFSNRGAAKLKLGEPLAAIADFNTAIGLQPQNPAALNGRGMARMELGQTAGAIRDYARSVGVSSAFAQGYRNRAAGYLRMGQPAEAVEDLSRALAFDARRVEDYLARGDAYLAMGNAAAAMTDFGKSAELNPRSVDAYIGLGYAKVLLNTIEDAIADLSRAVELDPRSPRAYAVRAWAYIRGQQLELAEKDVDRAMRLEPVTADAYWAQGEVKEALGDRDAATGAYARALGIDIRHRDTLGALARLGLEPQREDAPVAAAGNDGWFVSVANGTTYTATHPQFSGLRVSLEMMGEGKPRILQWERQNAPFARYGLLRYDAGVLPMQQGAVHVECSSLVDLASNTVIGSTVDKIDHTTASYRWGEDKLVVTGADGFTDTIMLGDKRERRDGAEAAAGRTSGRYPPDGTAPPKEMREASTRRAPPPRKTKSLFEMIFGN